MNYFMNKDELTIKAKEHTKEMARDYADEITNSIMKSRVFSGDFATNDDSEHILVRQGDGMLIETPIITFKMLDTVSALFDGTEGKTCVLNFASYKHPGGMFLKGSSAQEESLCHESFLYNVIGDSKFKDYYDWNNANLNQAFYKDRAIYSPKIRFIRGDRSVISDVITCAAPNYGVYSRYHNDGYDLNHKIVADRLRFIKTIVEDRMVKTLILGAWGCGVFKQPVDLVALTMMNVFYHCNVENIIIAIPDKKTYDVFHNIFEAEGALDGEN